MCHAPQQTTFEGWQEMSENGSPSDTLTTQQRRAIRALLTCKTLQEAATTAQIAERTLYRWMQDADFRAALFAAEGELIDGATRRLLRLQDSAIDVLDDLLTATGDAVKLRAAQTVLDHLLRLRELRDIETRLAALELALQQQGQP